MSQNKDFLGQPRTDPPTGNWYESIVLPVITQLGSAAKMLTGAQQQKGLKSQGLKNKRTDMEALNTDTGGYSAFWARCLPHLSL